MARARAALRLAAAEPRGAVTGAPVASTLEPAPPLTGALLPSATSAELVSAPPARGGPRSAAMLASGLALWSAGWALDVGASYSIGGARPWLSLIPVFGPFAQLGQSWTVTPPSATGNAQLDAMANARIDAINQTAQKVATAVLVVDGLLQLTGLAMTVAGAVPRRTTGERRPALAIAAHGLVLRF